MNSRSLCWYSTPESRAAGKVSVLAVAETILSVAVYCWIAFALYGFIALAHAICKVPPWFAQLLSWNFGPAACGRS